jgi:hypothetical protein
MSRNEFKLEHRGIQVVGNLKFGSFEPLTLERAGAGSSASFAIVNDVF